MFGVRPRLTITIARRLSPAIVQQAQSKPRARDTNAFAFDQTLGNGLLRNFDPASPKRQGTSIAFVMPMRGPVATG